MSVRRTNAVLLLNGERASGLIEVEVNNNNFYAADEWRAVLSLSASGEAFPWDYWASTASIRAEIRLGAEGAEEMVIVGEVDRCTTDPVRDTVSLTGRDLSASLIDNRSRNKLLNWRPHQIAKWFAHRHKLKAVVTRDPSNRRAGSMMNQDTSEIDFGPSHWDLLTFLAQRMGYELYVEGDTLYFVLASAVERPVWPLSWQGTPSGAGNSQAPVMEMAFERNLVLAQDVTVYVLSWDFLNSAEVSAEARSSARTRIIGPGGLRPFRQIYTYELPDLTPNEAQALALEKLEEITRHERRLRFAAPGDNALTPRSMIRLGGTATSYDQDYYPDHIVRTWSRRRGYVMRVRAKNHSPSSVVVVTGPGLPTAPQPVPPQPDDSGWDEFLQSLTQSGDEE